MSPATPKLSLQHQLRNVDPPQHFYNCYAAQYDDLFADLRDDSDHLSQKLLIPTFRQFGCKAVVDIGCGTGYDLQAIHTVAQSEGLNLALHGFDICEEMVVEAKKRLGSTVRLESGPEWNIADEGFIDCLRSRRGYANIRFDAVICMGNLLCHVDPTRHLTVFRNMNAMLRTGGLAIVEFRDGNKMREFISQSPHEILTEVGTRRCAYEHRSLIHKDKTGGILDSFFRYLEYDECTFTANMYVVEISDSTDHSDDRDPLATSGVALRSMRVCYVIPNAIRAAMQDAGFVLNDPIDFQSVLRYGVLLMGIANR